MGAWGVDTFDNDTACDWAYELEDVHDLSLVRETLDRVLAVGEAYLDADDGCEGLAACEVIARLKGNYGIRNAYTEAVDEWVKQHASLPTDDLVDPALAVIERVLTAPSELLELWEEGDAAEWRRAVEALRNRVAA
ncbi:MAG: DUF4259 domain-containing protein [Anaerolineae bacterium]|nr:DUF4259 domain-containing protein [Anaerolineae bacterium]